MMKNCVVKEFAHLFYSGRLFTAVFVFFLIFSGAEFLNYKAVKNNIESLEMTIKARGEMGHDPNEIDTLIYEDYEYTPMKDGYSVRNPLAYDWAQICRKKYTSSSKYAVMQSLENMISLAPLLFTLMGAMFGAFDFRYGTNKIKVSRNGKTNNFFSKQTVMIGEAVGLCILSTVIAWGTSLITERLASKAAEKYPYRDVFEPGVQNVFMSLLIAAMIILLFVEMGFCFSVIFKNTAVPVIMIVLYWYACPPLGKFEPRNMISALTDKHFSFYGWVVNNGSYDVNTGLCAVVLCLGIIVMVSVSFFVLKKRSAF